MPTEFNPDPKNRHAMFDEWRDLDVKLVTSHSVALGEGRDAWQNAPVNPKDVAEVLTEAQREAVWFESDLPRIVRDLIGRTAASFGVEAPPAVTEAPYLLGVTGHRLDKLEALPPANVVWIHDQFRRILTSTRARYRDRGLVAVTGMAVGIDQWWAEDALALGVPVWASVPFEGQDRIWPEAARKQYASLLERAWRVTTLRPALVDPKMIRTALLERNRWMAARISGLVAVWDGTDGGTAHMVQTTLRESSGCPVLRMNPKGMTMERMLRVS